MGLFGGKKSGTSTGTAAAGISGFTRPRRFLFFKLKARPVFVEKPKDADAAKAAAGTALGAPGPLSASSYKRPDKLQMYFMSVAAKQKNLDDALRARGIKEAPYEFVRKMFSYALIVSAMMVVAFAVLLYHLGLGATGLLLAAMLGVAMFQALFNKFVRYPLDRSKVEGTNIERDILFAARDLVISMRSGMPLFNAMATVSSGYGAASKEFGKVVELIQLGTPAEQAIDDVSGKSQSKTFKRIMLQASVSIRVGADVVGALQGVVDEVTQERIIELRRYGQRLNVLSMFYMLFGVIFPSMGVAVAVILTTFVNIFTVTGTTLIFVLVAIFFLQIIFLEVMRSSRPVFAM
jgi:archaeal flagellar protein FlaJ